MDALIKLILPVFLFPREAAQGEGRGRPITEAYALA
jgi:hypothetical protein